VSSAVENPTAPQQPAEGQPQGHPRRWLILAVLCLTLLTVVIDNTVLNVAIPSLSKHIGATTSDIQWVINAYSLVQAGLLLTAGGMADRYGRKLFLMIGVAVFGIGSGIAALASSPGQLIAARAFMGIGGALLMSTVLAVLIRIFPPQDQPKAIGIWAAVSSLGFIGGPLLGGFLLEHFWWGSIFLVNIPVAVLALIAAAVMVPESKDPRGDRPDLGGAVLSTIGMTALVFAVISGPQHGWGSTRVLLAIAVALLGLSAFILWERRVAHPMLDMSFFRNPMFTGAVSGGILIAFGMGGSLFLLTQHLQFVLGYTPLQAGLRIAPMALSLMAINFSGLGAKLLKALGTSRVIAFGMITMALGLASIAAFADSGYGGTLVGLILMGVGIGVSMPAMAGAIMGAIPPEKAGVGSALNGTLSELGNTLGVAVLGAMLTAWFAGNLPSVFGDDAAESLPEAYKEAKQHPDVDNVLATVKDAFSDALTSSQFVGAAAVLIGGLVAAYLLRRSRVGTPETTGDQAPAQEPKTTEA
jgi:EmrB/QacA subfamily drug resistance transporter